jgi:hypothetical protein
VHRGPTRLFHRARPCSTISQCEVAQTYAEADQSTSQLRHPPRSGFVQLKFCCIRPTFRDQPITTARHRYLAILREKADELAA